MCVRNKVQTSKEMKPFLARVNSGETEELPKPVVKLWKPRFKRASGDRNNDSPLALESLVEKLDKNFLSV